MNIYYFIDKEQQKKLNGEGCYYTPAYIPEVLSAIGAYGTELSSGELACIQPEDILLITAQRLSASADNLPECRRIIFPMCSEKTPGIKAMPRLDGVIIPLVVPLSGEAVTETDNSLEFGFDLPGQLLFSGDGSEREPQHGFFTGRVPDTVPLPDDMRAAEPYNDAVLKKLSDKLRSWGVPITAPLPPVNGRLPQLGFMVSGDDDCTSAETNKEAAGVMESLGIPYHINAMAAAGTAFCINREDYLALKQMGCEIALHADLTAATAAPAKAVKEQAELFEKTFGEASVTNSNHCFIQTGTCEERLRALEAAGIIADNSKLGEVDPGDINAFGLMGFGFGSIHPRYSLAAPAEGNRQIACMELPITYYEPRVGGRYGNGEKITEYLQLAEKYMGVAQFFIHPHYLCSDNTDAPKAVAALMQAMLILNEKCVWLTTGDTYALWWQQRRSSRVRRCENRILVQTAAPTVVLLPEGTEAADGYNVQKTEDGIPYIVIPAAGEYEIFTN